MIRFHDLNVKRFAADRALAALPFIDLTARVGIKSTDTQMVDVMVKDIGKDAGYNLVPAPAANIMPFIDFTPFINRSITQKPITLKIKKGKSFIDFPFL
jgi:hypothetical protein